MNSIEVKQFLSSLPKHDPRLSIPILGELSLLVTGVSKDISSYKKPLVINGKIERIYHRMRRIQEELGRLDFKKASAGETPEDFVFSRIDFSRYREIEAPYFEALFTEGPDDFDEGFLRKTFGLGRAEIKTVIKDSYKKIEDVYKIQRDNPVILSVMRCMETSLENSPLFTPEEIEVELKNLSEFLGSGKKLLPGAKELYSLLVLSLDGVHITHRDGMKTKLFASGGKLLGTFLPAGKPWTP